VIQSSVSFLPGCEGRDADGLNCFEDIKRALILKNDATVSIRRFCSNSDRLALLTSGVLKNNVSLFEFLIAGVMGLPGEPAGLEGKGDH